MLSRKALKKQKNVFGAFAFDCYSCKRPGKAICFWIHMHDVGPRDDMLEDNWTFLHWKSTKGSVQSVLTSLLGSLGLRSFSSSSKIYPLLWSKFVYNLFYLCTINFIKLSLVVGSLERWAFGTVAWSVDDISWSQKLIRGRFACFTDFYC